jgi:hypothetical protein
MRALLTLLCVWPAVGVSVARAQTDYYARLGVTFATDLVTDNIVQDIATQQSLAPTLAFGVSLPIAPGYSAGLETALSTSGYHSTEADQETDLGNLATGSVLLNLEGPIRHRASWRAGIGLISYLPSDDSGIFLSGGTTRFLAGAGFDYRPPLLTHWDLMVSLRYDFHRFSTDELDARGFTGSQGVQRVSLSLGLARARR